jgi:hypothetical protein
MAVTAVASTTTSTTLLAANPAREHIIITNDDANALYVRLDSGTASTTAYSFKLDEGEDAKIDGYEGEVTGIWSGDGTGGARITEY